MLGMALVNEGNLAGAAAEFETYLEARADRPERRDGEVARRAAQEVSVSIPPRSAPGSAGVRDRIARAAGRAGRDPASVRLIAVSKTFSVDHVRAAAAAGQVDFGENKVQEALAEDGRQLATCRSRWHLIGHLQSNKARKAAARFDVDPLRRHRRAARRGSTRRRRQPDAPIELLVQVDLAGEATKHGARPGRAAPDLRGRRRAAAPRASSG